ncbi:MAG: hypothetical protein J5817_00055 [Treponema sp.]|nr:hypothetical protein [Treponema sp.]
MKKFRKVIAALFFAVFGMAAFAYEGEGIIRGVVDSTHLKIRNIGGRNEEERILIPDCKIYDENDELVEKPNFGSMVNRRIYYHANENREITAIYIMVNGYEWHSYRGKGRDLKTIEGTYVNIYDGKLHFFPYGSKSMAEYNCGSPVIYNENKIRSGTPGDIFTSSRKIRVVYEVGNSGEKYVLDIYMLPAQYDFATKTVGGKAEKATAVNDDGWGDKGLSEEVWDGWNDRMGAIDYTVSEGYGYFKSEKNSQVKIARKDGKYKFFKNTGALCVCRAINVDGKKCSWGKIKLGQYVRYLVVKFNNTGDEQVVEVRALKEGTKFDENRFVPENQERVEILHSRMKKKSNDVCQVMLFTTEKWEDYYIDENTRFYDSLLRSVNKPPFDALYFTYYEKDGKKYIYDLYGREYDTW